jgi:hypothetical protein
MRMLKGKGRKAALGMLGLAVLAGGAMHIAPASAGEVERTLQINGKANIEDYETFSSNEHCNNRKLFGSDRAGDAYGTTGTPSASAKCGGEIRVEVHGSGTIDAAGNFCNLRADVLFFEGASESTNDLDGRASVKWSGCIAPGAATSQKKVHVWNSAEDEAQDQADVWITLKNF